jgi:hypothetical protein
MIVQVYCLDGSCIELHIPEQAEIIVWRADGPDRYFHLDAGRYVEARTVVWV